MTNTTPLIIVSRASKSNDAMRIVLIMVSRLVLESVAAAWSGG